MKNAKEVGRIFVNIGPMFSFKTEEAMRQVKVALKRGVVFFRPYQDTRQNDPTEIRDHAGNVLKELRATIVKTPQDVLDFVQDQEVVFFDEGQLFPQSLAKDAILKLSLAGKEVFYFGLNLTWRGELWPTTKEVLGLPDYKLTEHRGYCELCKNRSTMSQLIDRIDSVVVRPVSLIAPEGTIKIGGEESFRGLCLPCWLETTPDSDYFFRPDDLKSHLFFQKEVAEAKEEVRQLKENIIEGKSSKYEGPHFY